jgi:hypothetical protein
LRGSGTSGHLAMALSAGLAGIELTRIASKWAQVVKGCGDRGPVKRNAWGW